MDKQNQKKYKIVMLGSLPPLRGLSSYCFELSLAISNFHRLEFLSFKSLYPSFLYPGGNLNDDQTFPDISPNCLAVRRKLTWYNPVTWLIAGLYTKADIFHAQWWSLPLLPIYAVISLCFKLRSIPIIYTVHNVVPHEKSSIYFALTRLLFKLADHFIVHTSHNVNQMVKYYKIQKEKISQIPHGALDFYLKNQIDRTLIRREMGFSDNDKIILFFGAIRQYKGLDLLLKAFSKVSKSLPEVKLLIAGKLWENWQPYENLIKSLNIQNLVTTFLDYVPSAEVYKFFEASDLVILPYLQFDSQSGVGTTAIAFKKPLIVSNIGGLPELVSDRRYSVPPKDTDSLAKAIIHCFSNPIQMKAMSSSAAKIANELSWSTIAKKTRDIYHRMLEHK